MTEGVICEIPNTSFVLSVDENPTVTTDDGMTLDMQPELKNAAILFQQKALSLKIAAGSLAVTGAGGSSRLSASLPGKDDGAKDKAVFVSWKSLALLGSEERAILQLHPGFFRILPDAPFKTELAASLTAGWRKLSESTDPAWFLRYPWHGNGNLYYLDGGLSARFSFSSAKLTAESTVSLSLPDILPQEVAGALKLLLRTERTETSLSCAGTPASFVLPTGAFTPDTFKTDAAFSFESPSFKMKADASVTQKQPAHALELSKLFHEAALSLAYTAGSFRAGVAVQAAKLCFADECRDGELSPKLELTLSGTSLSTEATILPFRPEDDAEKPDWSVKAASTVSGLTASYTAEIGGTWLEKQEFSLKEERDSVSLSTAVIIKNDSLTWNLSFSKEW
ncbi:MAG: hypothetical protein KBT02_08920 [Treponema sp.]|nr:hypothetical protein [Candidatus Treponema caballi]